jgi:hypothetical protein
MVYFQTKNPNLGKFWGVLEWKMLVYFMESWPRYIVYGQLVYAFYAHLAYFMVIWYIFPQFGILYQEKSGNPGNTSTSFDNT